MTTNRSVCGSYLAASSGRVFAVVCSRVPVCWSLILMLTLTLILSWSYLLQLQLLGLLKEERKDELAE